MLADTKRKAAVLLKIKIGLILYSSFTELDWKEMNQELCCPLM
jgi:hypothetical protein